MTHEFNPEQHHESPLYSKDFMRAAFRTSGREKKRNQEYLRTLHQERLQRREVFNALEAAQSLEDPEYGKTLLKEVVETPNIDLLLVMGPPGSGKSTFIQDYSHALEENGIEPIKLSFDQFRAAVIQKYNLPTVKTRAQWDEISDNMTQAITETIELLREQNAKQKNRKHLIIELPGVGINPSENRAQSTVRDIIHLTRSDNPTEWRGRIALFCPQPEILANAAVLRKVIVDETSDVEVISRLQEVFNRRVLNGEELISTLDEYQGRPTTLADQGKEVKKGIAKSATEARINQYASEYDIRSQELILKRKISLKYIPNGLVNALLSSKMKRSTYWKSKFKHDLAYSDFHLYTELNVPKGIGSVVALPFSDKTIVLDALQFASPS